VTGARVLVACGSPLRRAAMLRLLEDAGFEVSGLAGDAADLLRKVRAHRPAVAIAELPAGVHPRSECVNAVRTIRRELPGVGLLLISQAVSPAHAAALLEGGAEGVGYLVEGRVAGTTHFVSAVRAVAARGSVVDPEVVTHLLSRDRRDPVLEDLSERERTVLAQMAAGVSNRGIAQRMFLSERAIERHVTRIFAALGLAAARQANRRVLAVLAYLAVTPLSHSIHETGPLEA
jgi:DNA-binding NarL/FixJ family response regulator